MSEHTYPKFQNGDLIVGTNWSERVFDGAHHISPSISWPENPHRFTLSGPTLDEAYEMAAEWDGWIKQMQQKKESADPYAVFTYGDNSFVTLNGLSITSPCYDKVSLDALVSHANHGVKMINKDHDHAKKPVAQVEEWDGEGLPPVGTVCEYSLGDSTMWFKCNIVYHVGTQGVVMGSTQAHEGIQYCSLYGDCRVKFRPLKTEEEREREEFVKSVTKEHGDEPEEMAHRLWNIGLRFTK